VKRKINGIDYEVIKEGGATPFSFVPGGTKMICDNQTNFYALVALQINSKEDMEQYSTEQSAMIVNLKQELKNIQDELVKKDGEITRLTAQIEFLTKHGIKVVDDPKAIEHADNGRPKAKVR
jgi:seryl-tRNA synthetase